MLTGGGEEDRDKDNCVRQWWRKDATSSDRRRGGRQGRQRQQPSHEVVAAGGCDVNVDVNSSPPITQEEVDGNNDRLRAIVHYSQYRIWDARAVGKCDIRTMKLSRCDK